MCCGVSDYSKMSYCAVSIGHGYDRSHGLFVYGVQTSMSACLLKETYWSHLKLRGFSKGSSIKGGGM